jgi:cation:H+ antiporter
VSLLLLADVLYRGGPILADVQGPVVFVAAIGAGMTCLYVWGLVERQNRAVLRMGWDSVAAVLLYSGGMTVLWFLR